MQLVIGLAVAIVGFFAANKLSGGAAGAWVWDQVLKGMIAFFGWLWNITNHWLGNIFYYLEMGRRHEVATAEHAAAGWHYYSFADWSMLNQYLKVIESWFPLQYCLSVLVIYLTIVGLFIVVKFVLKLIPGIG